MGARFLLCQPCLNQPYPAPISMQPGPDQSRCLPFPTFSVHPTPSVSHGVLAKLVAELLDEQSQLAGGLRLLLQELVAEAGNILLDLLQLTYNGGAHMDTRRASWQTNLPIQGGGLLTAGGTHLR